VAVDRAFGITLSNKVHARVRIETRLIAERCDPSARSKP
jgi:hypothetical protein